MQRSEVDMFNPRQVAYPLNADPVLAQFMQATQLLFRRRMDGCRSESAIPGLEVSDSDWIEWEQVQDVPIDFPVRLVTHATP